jgi:hypothetical protein
MAKKKKLPPIEVCATMRTLHEIETRAPNTHEGDNAKTALDRMLAKHGLARADIPDILAELEDDPRYATQRDPQPAQAADDRHPDEMRVNCLALLLRVIETHLYMPSPHERLAVALWCLHSHLIGRFEHSPRLAITSPVRRCGKTTLMKILELVCARATRFVDPSVAGLRQTLTEDEATLLIDEGDNLGLLKDRSMRSFLHDGFERGSYVLRGGLHGRPIRIPIHAAAAVACISKSSLSLPLLDRSVPIKMRRRPRSSPRLERFNRYNPVFPAARRQIEYWTRDAKLNLDPELPDQMDDRAQDCWRVLIASADDLGMGAEAREAAIALSISREACDPVIMLLRGIRRAFGHADGRVGRRVGEPRLRVDRNEGQPAATPDQAERTNTPVERAVRSRGRHTMADRPTQCQDEAAQGVLLQAVRGNLRVLLSRRRGRRGHGRRRQGRAHRPLQGRHIGNTSADTLADTCTDTEPTRNEIHRHMVGALPRRRLG